MIIGFSFNYDKMVFYLRKPKTTPVTLAPRAIATSAAILLPLDQRPPCLQFVKQLGLINGISIIVPPAELLGNYKTPGNTAGLRNWLTWSTDGADALIVSIDMLLHGGLVASRSPTRDENAETSAMGLLRSLKQSKNIPLYAFSIIPRLLIPENDATKLWQYHMMIYAIKKDMYDAFGHDTDFIRMADMLSVLPPELVEDFNLRYSANDKFNQELCLLAASGAFDRLIVGQDDGQPFGRPNANKRKTERYIGSLNIADKAFTSCGADELAMLELAAYANERRRYTPKIKVMYSTETAANMVMPFMPATVQETVREKIAAVGARAVEDAGSADIILFVHCGDEKTSASDIARAARQVHALAQSKLLALVDLSVNFQRRETVMSALLAENIPLSSLSAYAGWNTAGNSIGTALAQSALFSGTVKSSAAEHLPYVYHKNFEFTIARVLDDWLYQKDVQAKTGLLLDKAGLGRAIAEKKELVLGKIKDLLEYKQERIFLRNIGLHPFYSDDKRQYYIVSLETKVDLPWSRLFEISLTLKTETGESAK
ncbi:MAG: DUF4127 family protein [Acidaminococcales bacterium]|jgi:hypothetical protein|nr:DUF4127 family protein [Acidaminococcales bacterium]